MNLTHALIIMIVGALLPVVVPLPSVTFVYGLLCVTVVTQLFGIAAWRRSTHVTHLSMYCGLCMLAMQCSLWHLLSLHQKQLPDDWTPSKVSMTAEVVSLPKQARYAQYHSQQFVVRVVSIDAPANRHLMPAAYVSVNWYNHDIPVRVGEVWALTLTIKNPRSLANDGSFDYRLWLLSKGITATASVVDGQRVSRKDTRWSINAMRERFRDKLHSYSHHTQNDLVLAVSIGDRSLMTQERWTSFAKTGTSHLVAISGLHIGLFSALVYGIVTLLLRLWSAPLMYLPNTAWAAIASLVFTGVYVLLSGGAIPAQRAFIMLACVLLSSLASVQILMINRLLLAMLLIVLINPLSVFLDGFYLSFLCVVMLCLSLTGQLRPLNALQTALRSQFYLIWLLLPLSLYCFQYVSWQSSVVNLFAIPFFGLFVLPLTMAFTLSWSLSAAASSVHLTFGAALERVTEHIATLLDRGLEMFSQVIAWCQQFDAALSSDTSPIFLPIDDQRVLSLLFLALLIGVCLLKRWLLLYAMVLLTMWWAPSLRSSAHLELVTLDVGQGLAVLIKTRRHTLLYDVGGRSASGFNMANGVILPYLNQHSTRSIDTLIVSHDDTDHAGALPELMNALAVKRLLVGDERTSKRIPTDHAQPNLERCAQQAWRWDEVDFEIIYSDPDAASSNDRSCVLLVSWGTQQLLLTGDISKRAERALLREDTPSTRTTTVLIAPHHGSNTSSSTRFVDALQPQHVVFSVGYQHRFGHPHPRVVDRYQSINSRLWRTDVHGTITFRWNQTDELNTSSYTQRRHRFWNIRNTVLNTY